jgi:hypothetical protein
LGSPSSSKTRLKSKTLLTSVALAGLFPGLSTTAWAQANIHNGGITIDTRRPNTAQNTAVSGASTARGRNMADTFDYNTATLVFNYSITNSGAAPSPVWEGGVQYKGPASTPTAIPKNVNWVQPKNIDFPSGNRSSS